MSSRKHVPPFIDDVLMRCDYRRRGDRECWMPMSLSNFCAIVASWQLGSENAHRAIWEKLKRGEVVESPVTPGFAYKLTPEDREQCALDLGADYKNAGAF